MKTVIRRRVAETAPELWGSRLTSERPLTPRERLEIYESKRLFVESLGLYPRTRKPSKEDK